VGCDYLLEVLTFLDVFCEDIMSSVPT